MLQEQVHKENKLRKLREKFTGVNEGKYKEAQQRFTSEQDQCMHVRERVLNQIHEMRSRLVNFRQETLYSKNIINNEIQLFMSQTVLKSNQVISFYFYFCRG